MSAKKKRRFRGSLLLGGILAIGMLPAVASYAQGGDSDDVGSGYRTSESTAIPPASVDTQQPAPTKAPDPKDEGPVRMARFSYIKGNVTWRPTGDADWSNASNNLPVREGAEVWVTKGGRAEVQFDDGSVLRLGSGALVVLKVLYSDAQGEFTQITLKDGLATLHSRHSNAVYQVDTPFASVKTTGEAQIRFGVDGGSEIAVQQGSAAIDSSRGKTTVQAGKYLYLTDASSPYVQKDIPGDDSWDKFNADRNRLIAEKSETYRHVPSNIGLVSEDLDNYGTWHDDPKYGWVWAPTVSSPDWRPYYHGHWVWEDPYGWTWVGEEPWGWAPYHYGTWVDLSYGWAWCPGPLYQYWSPGVVSFCTYGAQIGWAPLCPWEVQYPAYFGFGYWGAGWGLSFSIGWAGCYYPFHGGFCVGRPFDNFYLNHFGHDGHFNNRFGGQGFGRNPGGLADNHFVPYNASHVAGGTFAKASEFGGQGSYQAANRGASVFTKGQSVTAPAGRSVVSGPRSVAPSSLSRTSTRSFTSSARPSQTAMQRSTYHAALPSNVQRSVATQDHGTTQTSQRSSGFTNGAADSARAARESLGFSSSRTGSGSGASGLSRNEGGSSRSMSGNYGSRGSSDSGSGRSYRVGSDYEGGRGGGSFEGRSGGNFGGGRSEGGSSGGGSFGGGHGGGGGGGGRGR